MKERTVYLVSEGEYSDYSVICVCDEERIAQQICEALTSKEDYHAPFVEKRPWYDQVPDIFRWFARISPTGAVVSCESWSPDLGPPTTGRDVKGNYYCMGFTKEDAIKRANDFRIHEQAKQQGIA